MSVCNDLLLCLGDSHKLMALIFQLEKELITSLEPLKEKVEDRVDELSALVEETAECLNLWDTDTEQSVADLREVRDQQVGIAL